MRRTLQAALDLGAEGVVLTCSACLNVARFSPREALKRWRADALAPLPIVPKDWGRPP